MPSYIVFIAQCIDRKPSRMIIIVMYMVDRLTSLKANQKAVINSVLLQTISIFPLELYFKRHTTRLVVFCRI